MYYYFRSKNTLHIVYLTRVTVDYGNMFRVSTMKLSLYDSRQCRNLYDGDFYTLKRICKMPSYICFVLLTDGMIFHSC